jgi:outer membrane protein assembly factor BamB
MRDFKVETSGLADEWPKEGPPKLWHRELGDGYAGMAVDGGRLYTMYRRVPEDEIEYTVALDAKSGVTLWEKGAASPITENMARFGPGPHSTPLVVDDRLYSVGANLDFRCFDATSGEILWEHDLLETYKFVVPTYGYAASPLAYGSAVIVPVVGDEHAHQKLVALDQKSGAVVWESERVDRGTSEHCAYASPYVIRFSGEDQLLFMTNEQLVGLDPQDGRLLWTHPCSSGTGVNVSTPVFDGKDIVFVSSAYDSGARAIRLKRRDGRTETEELWYSRKLRIHHGNAMLLGDHVYASSGDFGSALFLGMNVLTGKRAWADRRFAKANCVYADGKLIILDENGQLALATATPDGLDVRSTCQVTERLSWTVPTLVGTTLYVRDRKHIMALDLSDGAQPSAG